MTGRLEAIDVPAWDVDELAMIAEKGFPLLHLQVESTWCVHLAAEAYGSPHLMQEFCRAVAESMGVTSTLAQRTPVPSQISDDLFRGVADQTGKIVFDKLAKGPRQRKDRIQRKLKDGSTADIYGVTLRALGNLQPGLSTVEYEQLRASIRDILQENIPQAQEVSRVLEKMSQIASSDEASTPVLDWEKEEQRLHVTDPFFAFYLKWGSAPDNT